jgi:hypothetical protein
MTPSKRLKKSIRPRWLPVALGFVAFGYLTGCSTPSQPSQGTSEACAKLAETLTDQKIAFVARVKTIRDQHLLALDYDRQMIAALNQRRAAIESTELTELSVADEVSGCSGEPLGVLRRQAHEEMTSLQSFLVIFNRALKVDPAGAYIEQR